MNLDFLTIDDTTGKRILMLTAYAYDQSKPLGKRVKALVIFMELQGFIPHSNAENAMRLLRPWMDKFVPAGPVSDHIPQGLMVEDKVPTFDFGIRTLGNGELGFFDPRDPNRKDFLPSHLDYTSKDWSAKFLVKDFEKLNNAISASATTRLKYKTKPVGKFEKVITWIANGLHKRTVR